MPFVLLSGPLFIQDRLLVGDTQEWGIIFDTRKAGQFKTLLRLSTNQFAYSSILSLADDSPAGYWRAGKKAYEKEQGKIHR